MSEYFLQIRELSKTFLDSILFEETTCEIVDPLVVNVQLKLRFSLVL